MNHEMMKEQVYLFYDGELSTNERSGVEAHLASCEECRVMLDGWKLTKGVFLAKPVFRAPVGFAAAVMARLDESTPWYRRLGFIPRLTVAGSLVLASLIWMVYPHQAVIRSGVTPTIEEDILPESMNYLIGERVPDAQENSRTDDVEAYFDVI